MRRRQAIGLPRPREPTGSTAVDASCDNPLFSFIPCCYACSPGVKCSYLATMTCKLGGAYKTATGVVNESFVNELKYQCKYWLISPAVRVGAIDKLAKWRKFNSLGIFSPKDEGLRRDHLPFARSAAPVSPQDSGAFAFTCAPPFREIRKRRTNGSRFNRQSQTDSPIRSTGRSHQ